MKLKKDLTLIHVFCIASGAMISSGLFILPGLAHARAGPAVVVSYFLAGLLAATGLLSMAELATAMPKAGGDYYFITRAMGTGVGTVAGLLNWFSLSLKSAFALVGMAAFASLIAPIDPRVTGAALTVLFVAVNLCGAREAARLQVALVLGLFALMLLYVVRGVPEVSVQRFEPFAPGGLRAIFSTAGFVFVSYGGLLKVASVAEEVKRPGRTIPLALILSLLVVGIFYTLMVVVTCGVLDRAELNSSLTPISDGAAAFMGRGGRIALSIGAILAFVSTANAGILAASRYLLALSSDGLLPAPLGKISARFGAPYVAIMVTGGLMIIALFLKLDALVKVASTALILSYILSNLSIIVLRESRVQNYRPTFRAPLYPWVQIAGIIGLVFVLVEMGEEAFLISAVLVVLGFVTFWFYGRSRANRESALLHLVQRITARELVTGSLEAELKQVIRERDEIEEDRFDRLIEQCIVLDIEESMDADGLFGLVAKELADRVKMGAPELLELLKAREQESGTVLRPGLAIPHIVVNGEHVFDVLLVRARPGISFAVDEPPVQAAFVLVGSADERNYHLRALAAIAQIVQDPDFERSWMAAYKAQALRDIILLGKRRRG